LLASTLIKTEDTPMSLANQQTMQRFIDEVINQRCLAAIDELVHANYVFRSPDQRLHGRQALAEFFATYHTAFPDLKVHIDDMLCTDDKVVIMFTLTATHENEFMGIAATGNKLNVNGMIWSRIHNGQVIEEWELLDQLSMFRQLGLVSV
jgi:steroid delta-isomerase-like uncharacterized protein